MPDTCSYCSGPHQGRECPWKEEAKQQIRREIPWIYEAHPDGAFERLTDERAHRLALEAKLAAAEKTISDLRSQAMKMALIIGESEDKASTACDEAIEKCANYVESHAATPFITDVGRMLKFLTTELRTLKGKKA